MVLRRLSVGEQVAAGNPFERTQEAVQGKTLGTASCVYAVY